MGFLELVKGPWLQPQTQTGSSLYRRQSWWYLTGMFRSCWLILRCWLTLWRYSHIKHCFAWILLKSNVKVDRFFSPPLQELGEEEQRGYQALFTVNEMVNLCEPFDPSSFSKAHSVAHKFFSQRNGDSQHTAHAMGHCHIDTGLHFYCWMKNQFLGWNHPFSSWVLWKNSCPYISFFHMQI